MWKGVELVCNFVLKLHLDINVKSNFHHANQILLID